jgi:hypothetical protein
MKFKTALIAAAGLIALNAQAVTVAQWTYEGGTTKHDVSMNGAGFAALGGVTTSFAAGSGSPAGNALNTTNYAAQGAGNLTRGVEYRIDTSGYENLVFSFDQRNSNTASAWTALLYTLDNVSWTQATTFFMPVASATTFVKGLSFDFGGIAGTANNENFGVRLLAMFAPGTGSYAQTSGASYGTSGTIRYDMVTLSGTEIAAPIPEASSVAMMLAGLGIVGMVARRRRAD